MALKALIFDVDGTLAETEFDGHRVAFNEAFAAARLGWHWDLPTYRRLLAVTGGKERMLAWWRELDPVGAEAGDVPARIRELHFDKTARYAALVAAGRMQLRPGVERLLGEARAAGLRLAIATTTTFDNVEALLRHTLGEEATGWFEVIGAGDAVAAKKPAPDIYRHVLARLGIDANEAIAFEDSGPGLASALAAGLACVVTPSLLAADAPFDERALAVIDHLGEDGAAAGGIALGRPWRGVLGPATLAAWRRVYENEN
ncbi:HAD-IA family hydrolase [Rivibacter subsaxonicus]|uniref:HAD superfamily hydrolase (TIGR01509 family) n=1 Tax=Rivibacter subsaxonicus TaxID=457575 RepID=A0A4Q7W032_9BURK|nr:HAD-IA family hydrolase [Rivibacter subsaxonicus]RZU02343.1 HAD superfamily hydrolase (TIGR01509 family) [Rivibacter subsaxonicus]